MGSEVLLYGYGIICLSMIVFNVIYGLVMRGSEARLFRRSRSFEEAVEGQLRGLGDGQPVEERHIKWLQRRLARIGNLTAFDQMLERYLAHGGDAQVREYLAHMQPVILHLAAVYQKRENLQAAYFAYFLSRHNLKTYMRLDEVQGILMEYMKKDSLYCRVNTLKALCTFGSPEAVVEAVAIQDESGSFLHEKILTECLLAYTGDSGQLIGLFWERLDRFSNRTKLAVLNYIRFQSGAYCPEMFRIMTDPKRDRELRFSAIRYFGRYPYGPAKEQLLKFLREPDPRDWEYAAISASALARYEGEDVIQALMQAVHSGNWHIRYNAAASLEAHHLDYSDLIELVGGRDRYAREMMMYRLESRRMEAAGKEAAKV